MVESKKPDEKKPDEKKPDEKNETKVEAQTAEAKPGKHAKDDVIPAAGNDPDTLMRNQKHEDARKEATGEK